MARVLNKQFQFLLKQNNKTDFQIDHAYEAIVNEIPYRILKSTPMLFKVISVVALFKL